MSNYNREESGGRGSSSRQDDTLGTSGSTAESSRGNLEGLSHSQRRNLRQKLKAQYARIREDAQLAGVIETTPQGAARNEVVDPRLQGCQQLPELIRQALKECWAVPDSAKPGIIGALLEPFFSNDIVLDKDGNQVRVAPSRTLLIELARTLKMLDQTQFERDHPELAAKARGGGSISVNNNIQAALVLRGMIEKGELGGVVEHLKGETVHD